MQENIYEDKRRINDLKDSIIRWTGSLSEKESRAFEYCEIDMQANKEWMDEAGTEIIYWLRFH
ncbi:unnamed protein product [Oikopleura dioica]|uniref:Uncharacterized protein n=1 Tax=Oikopleura dioica TaxID=34765 RepID=E4Z5B6_OIKDI|nr:unnamed protein product [Oikopleura dioica]